MLNGGGNQGFEHPHINVLQFFDIETAFSIKPATAMQSALHLGSSICSRNFGTLFALGVSCFLPYEC